MPTDAQTQLMYAILSMDTYHRGADGGLNSILTPLPANIDGATPLTDRAFDETGFSAQAYTMPDGTIVIAYRGTDDGSLANLTKGLPDLVNGYPITLGNFACPQAIQAIQFYNDIKNNNKDKTIIVTGQSLGGALAGFVGSLFNIPTYVFDTAPYQTAVQVAYLAALAGLKASTFGIAGVDPQTSLSQFIYGTDTPPYPNLLNQGSYVTGEVISVLTQLGGDAAAVAVAGFIASNPLVAATIAATAATVRPYGFEIPYDPYDPDRTMDWGERHTVSTLVTLMYGEQLTDHNWHSAMKWIWPAWIDDDVASAIGLHKVPVLTYNDYNSHNVMDVEIAYTAVNKQGPFGTTALKSLFSDANTLGALESNFTDPNSKTSVVTWSDAASPLGEIIVQYAGDQAKAAADRGSTDGNADGTGAFNGLAEINQTHVLKVNLDQSKWAATFGDSGTKEIVGLVDLADSVDAELPTFYSGLGDVDRQFIAQQLNTAATSSKITQILMATANGDNAAAILDGSQAAKLKDGSAGGNLIIDGNGGDSIKGSGGQDFIFLGNNINVVYASWGGDVIVGGTGANTVLIDDSIFTDASKAGAANPAYFFSNGSKDKVDFGESKNDKFTLKLNPVQNAGSAPIADGKVWDLYQETKNGKTFQIWVDPVTSYSIDMPTDATTNTSQQTDDWQASGAPRVDIQVVDGEADIATLTGDWSTAQAIQKGSTIDGGTPAAGYGNKLDASTYHAAKANVVTLGNGKKVTENGISFVGNELKGTGLTFNNFQILQGTNNGDYLEGQMDFKQIVLGNGPNVVLNLSGGVLPGETGATSHWVKLDLGAGNSYVGGTTAAGSEIQVDGQNHHDVIQISQDTRISGLGKYDRLLLGSETISGATHNEKSEDPWYYSGDFNYEMQINTKGDLVIRPTWAGAFSDLGYAGAIDPNTYIADFQNSKTANITLVNFAFSSYRLLDLGGRHDQIWDVFNLEWKAWTGQTWNGQDPLVIDLAGTGLDFNSNPGTSGPRYDLNGDGFATPSSWTTTSEGFLVTVDASGKVSFVQNFADLAAYDANGDGVITASDLADPSVAGLPTLRIWNDKDNNHQPTADELLTLDQAGVSSISLNATTNPSGTFIGDVQVVSTASVTLSNGVSSTVGDVLLKVDTADSTFLGDTSVTANAAQLPDIFGRGTLPSLRVALSLDETAQITAGTLQPGQTTAAEQAITSTMQTLTLGATAPDLSAWRQAVLPILNTWTSTFSDPNPSPSQQWWQTGGTPLTAAPDYYYVYHVNSDGSRTIVNDIEYADGQWELDSSLVSDNAGTLYFSSAEDAAAQVETYGQRYGNYIGRITSAEISFLERYTGEPLYLGEKASDRNTWLYHIDSFVSALVDDLNQVAIRLFVQGPLSTSIFAGISYDATTDSYKANTSFGLEPVYQAIFGTLTQDDGASALASLKGWETILSAILPNFPRPDGLSVTQGYIFAQVVAAYEANPLQASLSDVANVLGVPASEIAYGQGTVTGNPGESINLFYVSGGDNTYVASNTNDDFVVGAHFGHSIIQETDRFLSSEINVLRFANLTKDQISASREGNDLILTRIDTGETLRIVNQFTDPGIHDLIIHGNLNDKNGVDQITFADGTVWTRTDMSFATALKGTHDQTITGTSGYDVLFAGPNDVLTAGGGLVNYVYERGDGNVTIATDDEDVGQIKYDTLIFGPGITKDDLIFTRAANTNDLIITFKDSTDTILVKNQFVYTWSPIVQGWFDRMDSIVFADGSSISGDDLNKIVLANEVASGGPVIGFAVDDTIDPGLSNTGRMLSGGDGSDSYNLDLGWGKVVIDQNPDYVGYGLDNEINFGEGISLSDLDFSRPPGNKDDLIITNTKTGDQVTIKGQFDYTYALIWSGWYNRMVAFNFADGTQLTADDLMPLLLQKSEASSGDLVYGFPADDNFITGLNNQYRVFSGGNGTDTYHVERGVGSIVIWQQGDYPLLVGNDTVSFGAGISFSDLQFETVFDPNHGVGTQSLRITIKGTNDQILVYGQYDNSGFNQIQSFTFADGSTYSWRDVVAATNSAPAVGNAYLVGNQSVSLDRIVAGTGDDVLEGTFYGGSHTFEFGAGFGDDIVYQAGLATGDVIQFDAGISLNDLEFAEDQNRLVVHVKGTTSTLTILGDGGTFDTFVSGFSFADGTVLTAAQVAALVTAPTIVNAIDRTLAEATSGNSVIKGGNTFQYRLGDGFVRIDGPDFFSTLNLVGIKSTDVKLKLDGIGSTTLVMTFASSPDDRLAIQLVPQSGYGYGITTTFSDGVTWTQGDLVNQLLAQETARGDTLIDTPIGDSQTPETLVSAPGTHYLEAHGDGTAFTFVWSLGDGQTTIEAATLGTQKTLQIHGVDPADVVAKRDPVESKNLNLFVDGSLSPSIILSGQLTGSPIPTIQFDNGTTWSYLDLLMKADGGIASSPTLTVQQGQTAILGTSLSDVIDLATYDVTVTSDQGGDDVYVYRSTSGNDTIYPGVFKDSVYYSAVRLPDLNQSDVIFTSVGLDLVITNTATGKSLTLKSFFTGGTGQDIHQGVEFFVFADGTTLKYNDVRALSAYRAGAGDQTVQAQYENATLAAGPGNDTLIAGTSWGGGQNTFLYASSDGNATLVNGNPTTPIDSNTLKLTDLNQSDVTFSQAGTDLDILVNATGKTIAVVGQLANQSFTTIDWIQFADGSRLSAFDAYQIVLNAQSSQPLTTIQGTPANDTITIGAGDKTIIGAGGSDTYIYSAATGGNDVIDDQSFDYMSPADKLVLTDLNQSDVTLSRIGNSNDLIITANATGKTITIRNQFNGDYDTIETIQFADGSTLSPAAIERQLLAAASAQVGGTVYGFDNANDTINAGPGDKTLIGGNGSDTYIYTAATGGNDVIDDQAWDYQSSADKLVLTDLNQSDVTFSRIGNSNDLVITVNATGKTVTVKNQFNGSYGTIETIQFADGSTVSPTDIELQLLAAASAQVGGTIYGFDNTNDAITAGPGDKTLIGGNGSDTYIYTAARGGNDVIDDQAWDYLSSADKLLLTDLNQSDVTFSRPANSNDLMITIAATGKTVTIKNEFSGSYGTIETLQFADGTVLGPNDVLQIIANSQSSDEPSTIYGTSGDDTLNAGRGDKTLIGYGGNDTYIYTAATGGNDVIDDQAWDYQSPADKLVFTDLNQSDVAFSRVGNSNDLVITIGTTGKTVTIKNEFTGYTGTIETIQFADGSTLTTSDVEAAVLATASAQSGGAIYGFDSAADTITAGPGDKTLIGGSGSDTYIYTAATGGNDVIDDQSWDYQSPADKLVFIDLNQSDVAFSRVGNSNDLVITIGTTGKAVTIKNEFTGYTGTIETIQFADGSTLSPSDLEAAVLATASAQTSGTIYGFDSANDTINAGPGDKTLIGGGGNDTYIYTAATGGNDVIDDQSWDYQSPADKLVLSDLNQSDVAFSRVGNSNDLIITIGSTGKTVTLNNEFTGYKGTIETLQFADGTSWNTSDIRAHTWLYAGPGDQTITASDNGDTLVAGTGNDLLYGGAGSDTFMFGTGTAMDTIYNFTPTGSNPDTLQFDHAVFAGTADVLAAASQVGSDVVIAANAQSAITLKNVALSDLSTANVRVA